MTYVIGLLAALFIGWDLAKPLKNKPALFYAGAFVLDALCVAGAVLGWSGPAWDLYAALVGQGILAFFLLTVVMFTGCFELGSNSRIRLKQVRQPLALASVILCLGHLAYAGITQGAHEGGALFLATCGVLLVLLAVLGVTSLVVVQDHMKATVLAAVQKCSYPFFVVLCIHAAMVGNAWVYGAVGAIYVIARVRFQLRKGRS